MRQMPLVCGLKRTLGWRQGIVSSLLTAESGGSRLVAAAVAFDVLLEGKRVMKPYLLIAALALGFAGCDQRKADIDATA